jgi:hypothetical protein
MGREAPAMWVVGASQIFGFQTGFLAKHKKSCFDPWQRVQVHQVAPIQDISGRFL